MTNFVDELPLYLNDFKPETQAMIRKFLGIKACKEYNLDVFPLPRSHY